MDTRNVYVGKGAANTANQANSAQLADANALTQLAQNQISQSNQLFTASYPGFAKSEDFYSALASGDPYAIARATSPANQQADVAAAGAKKNILENGPAGGEKNLALEQVDVNRGAQVGSTASQGYLNSFNALSQLAGQGVSAAQNASGQAISAYGASSSGYGQVAQNAQQQKGNTLGAFSSLGTDASTLGGAAIGNKGSSGSGGKGGAGSTAATVAGDAAKGLLVA